jgi:hypothetical protein
MRPLQPYHEDNRGDGLLLVLADLRVRAEHLHPAEDGGHYGGYPYDKAPNPHEKADAAAARGVLVGPPYNLDVDLRMPIEHGLVQKRWICFRFLTNPFRTADNGAATLRSAQFSVLHPEP